MCGILLNVVAADPGGGGNDDREPPQKPQQLSLMTNKNLLRRGPDHLGQHRVVGMFDHHDHHHRVELQASVLKMRSHSTLQPVSIQKTNTQAMDHHNHNQQVTEDMMPIQFCWNGEVYQRVLLPEKEQKGVSLVEDDDDEDEHGHHHHQQQPQSSVAVEVETVAGFDVDDTRLVADMLQQAHRQQTVMKRYADDDDSDTSTATFLERYAKAVATVLGQLINAEYAFCLVTPWAVYYGRDPQGRRSLLYWEDHNNNNHHRHNDNPHYSWKLVSVTEQEEDDGMQRRLESSRSRTTPASAFSSSSWREVVPGLVHEYRFGTGQTYATPIVVLPPPRNLPAALDVVAQQVSRSSNHTKPDNVAWSMWQASLVLEQLLREAVRLRVCGSEHNNNNTHSLPPTTTTTDDSHPQSPQQQQQQPLQKMAVLFSGGIDSVVLAALALQVLPTNEPLRLWNVSFVDQHDSSTTTTTTTTNTNTKSQDCLAAQASYEELQELFPHHTIRLETTQVSWNDMTEWESHIRTLIRPKNTTMDLNIATALWFASRGRRHHHCCPKKDEEASSSGSSRRDDHEENDNKHGIMPAEEEEEPRILLVGMGADEQLGGYGRHRKAFERGSSSSGDGDDDQSKERVADRCLREELDLDIGRLWERNLGRDDRVFSDHGKEARFPYLDFHVMHFLAQTPLRDVCDFSLPPGQGDKRILRLVAMRLGLTTASTMVKRAIQFGSRIAHVSDKRRFGSRRKSQGTAVV